MLNNAPNREKNIQKKIFVSEDENEKITKIMAQVGSHNFSDFARKRLTDKKIYHLDLTEIKEITVAISSEYTELQKIGNNINQIAKSLNSSATEATKEMLNDYEKELNVLQKVLRKKSKKQYLESKYTAIRHGTRATENHHNNS